MPAGPLAGRVALTTCASRGIGRAIALRLATAGTGAGLTARDAQPLEQMPAELRVAGVTAAATAGHVHPPEDVAEVVYQAVAAPDGATVATVLMRPQVPPGQG